MLYVYMLRHAGYSVGYFGAGVKKGIKANFQQDDLIQEDQEAAGIGFHPRKGKKRTLNMDLEEAGVT